MKRVFLLIVVPALLVALGFAQTPAASSNTNQMNIKGCLGGSDGNYTVAEDNTGQIFNITTSSADLKPHVGQDVKLIGQKAGAAQNSVAVTEVNMISEHCTAAAAVPAAAVSTPSENLSTPPASAAPAAAPDATVSTPPASAAPAAAPDATVSTPPASAAPAAAPDATVSTSPASAAPAAAPDATVSTPPASAAPAAAPDATVSTAPASAAPAAAPAAAAAVHPTRRTARLRKPSETPTVAAAPPEPVSTPSATAPVAPPSETTNIPAAPAAAATNASTSRSAGMLVFIVVVVLLIGTAVPLYNRWRKRKLLEQTKGQNLSFTKEAKSDPGKSDTTGRRKVA